MANFNYPYVPGYGTSMPQAQNVQYSNQPQYSQYQQSYASMPSYAQPMQGYSNAVNNKNIIWVVGRAGADSFQMEPGSRAVLLDSTDQVFYIKVVGMDGRPEPLMAFKYEPLNLNVTNESSQASGMDMSNYVTKEDFNELKRMLEDTMNKRNNQKGQNRND